MFPLEDHCGLQQPMLCAIKKTVSNQEKKGKPDYKGNDSYLSLVVLFILILSMAIYY